MIHENIIKIIKSLFKSIKSLFRKRFMELRMCWKNIKLFHPLNMSKNFFSTKEKGQRQFYYLGLPNLLILIIDGVKRTYHLRNSMVRRAKSAPRCCEMTGPGHSEDLPERRHRPRHKLHQFFFLSFLQVRKQERLDQ